jgi:hypothetical protein
MEGGCITAIVASPWNLSMSAGYEHSVETVSEALLACFDDPQLPLLQWNEVIDTAALGAVV